jgi:hypothetical protein
MTLIHELAESVGIGKQIDMDRLVGDRQSQSNAEIGSLSVQLLQQPMLARQFKVAVYDELVEHHAVPIGQRGGGSSACQGHTTGQTRQTSHCDRGAGATSDDTG